MINPDDIIKKSDNKYEIGMFALAWRASEMKDCKVKIVDENGMWYLLKDKS
jgi:DNA-directed RNA polymerase subunit K/omega